MRGTKGEKEEDDGHMVKSSSTSIDASSSIRHVNDLVAS